MPTRPSPARSRSKTAYLRKRTKNNEQVHQFSQHAGLQEKPKTGGLNFLAQLNSTHTDGDAHTGHAKTEHQPSTHGHGTGAHDAHNAHDAGHSHHAHSTAHTVKDGATRAIFSAEIFEKVAHGAHNHRATQGLSKAATGFSVVAAGAALVDAKNAISTAVQTGKSDDVKHAVSTSVSAGGSLAKVALVSQHANTALARRAGVVAGAVSLKYVASDVATASKDISQAVKTGKKEDLRTAVKSSSAAVSNTAWTSKMVLVPTAQKIAQHLAVRKVATAAAKKVGGKIIAEAAGRAAAKAAVKGAGKTAAVKFAIKAAAKTGAKRAVYRSVGRAAGKAAAKAAVKSGAKGVGRFVPGLNIAIAVADTAQATAIQCNPNASTAKKVAGWATAGLSIAAASNVPVVSQVAAGASLVTGFLRDIW